MPKENDEENFLEDIEEAEDFGGEGETPDEDSKEKEGPSSEEKPAEEKKPEEEGESKTPKKKDERWRDKYFKLKGGSTISEKPEERPQENAEDKEKAAKQFIKNVVLEAIKEQKAEEDKAISEFQSSLSKTLEENPEVKESDILNIIDEYEEELSGLAPEKAVKVAVKILKRKEESAGSKKKPMMPSSKRGSGSTEVTPKKEADTKGKTMWQLAQEAIQELRTKK